MTRRLSFLIPLALAGALLAGCGSDDEPDAEPTGSASAADEPTDDPDDDENRVESDDFSFTAPAGWEDGSDKAPGALLLYADVSATDGFADNLNVLDGQQFGSDPDAAVDEGKRQLEGQGFTDVTQADSADMDGDEAAAITATLAAGTMSPLELRTHQFLVSHDGDGYLLTFSFDENTSDADADALIEGVLESWRWA